MKSGTVFALVETVILVVGGLLISNSLDMPHCPKCDKIVNEVYDKYCPYCGHKLYRDSLVWYDEFDRINNEKIK